MITVKDLMSGDTSTSPDGEHWEPALPPPPLQWHTRLSNAWAVLYGRAIPVRQTEASDIEPQKAKKMTEPKWVPVTRELLDEGHEWLYKPMWIAIKDGPVVIGAYEWHQGRNPDRFVSVEYGDTWAFDASHVMALTPPTHPEK